ncbi:MAG: hypothetical protein IKF83_04910 [Clostridia bacterium]|nr:hypothetical protein [Clostridia bacterium]
MGDRRVADRRSPEEGVVKLETKKLVIYLIISTILVISIITNIVLGILYSNYKKSYDELIYGESDLNDDYSDEIDSSDSDIRDDYTCDLSIVGDKSQIKPGETVTYEIKAENIKAGSGIIIFEALLDYDTDAFDCEIVNDENSQWSKTTFTDDYLTMSRNDLLPNSDNQTIAKITLTAKEDIENGEQSLDISEIRFTADEDASFTIEDKSVPITISNE